MDATQLPDMISIKEIGELIGVSDKTVFNWKAAGDLPQSYKIGGSVRFRRSDIAKWIEDSAVPIKEAKDAKSDTRTDN